MARKSSHQNDSLLHWLVQTGEETLAQVVEELAGNRSLTDALTEAVRRASRTKGKVDKNMQTVLGLLNVPSRADYHRLLTKIETLQGSLLNVNMKLDRLLAATQKPKRPPRPRPEPPVVPLDEG